MRDFLLIRQTGDGSLPIRSGIEGRGYFSRTRARDLKTRYRTQDISTT